MTSKFWTTLALILSGAVLSGCGPAILAGAGAGAVILADKSAEEEEGGDGLF